MREQSARLETGARARAGDLCPDRAATASPAEETQLLDKIRARTLPKLRARQNAERAADASTLMKHFNEMRLHLAARRADVTFTRGEVQIVPATRWTHEAGFAKLDPLSPAENERVQAAYATRVAEINARLKADPSKAAVTRLGNALRDQVRGQGEREYARLIASDPALLLVGPERDVYAARTAYASGLEAELRDLPKLRTSPPSDEALAMVYFASTTTEVLREQPELCGAFRGLKARADRRRLAHDVAKSGLESAANLGSFASNVGCVAAGLITRSTALGTGCLAMSFASFLDWTSWTDGMGGARYRERQLLYGDYTDDGSTRSLAYTY